MRNKCAIVTGATGFVGWQMIRELVNENYDVYALTGHPESAELRWAKEVPDDCVVKPQFVFFHDTAYSETLEYLMKENIRGREAVFFHFAWEGSAGEKRSDYEIQLRNVEMALHCVDMAADLGCLFVGAGSIMEDDCVSLICKEAETFPTPYIYSNAKLMAHYLCKIQAEKRGIPFRWGKISNAYGEGDRTGRFINSMLKDFIENNRCKLSKCTQFYDFIYITDVARAFRYIAEKGRDNASYYIGSFDIRQLKDYVMEMYNIVKSDSELLFGAYPDPIVSFPKEYYNSRPLYEDTGFKSSISFKDGINWTLRWMNHGSICI